MGHQTCNAAELWGIRPSRQSPNGCASTSARLVARVNKTEWGNWYVILYLDVFFFINFIMNILILFLMKKILKLHAGIFRILMGSMTGTIIMLAVFFNTMLAEWEKAVVYYILLSLLMIRIVFGKASIQAIIARSCCMYVLAFFVGGVGNFLSYQIRQGKRTHQYLKADFRKDGMTQDLYANTGSMGVEGVLILAGIILCIVPALLKVSEYIKQEYMMKCKVSLYYEGKSVTGMALIDTGNQLKDWLTNCPVTVVQKDFIDKLLAENTKKRIEQYQKAEWSGKDAFLNTEPKLKYIPYHSLGNEHGMMVGMYFDKMTVFLKGEKKEIRHPLIGIYIGKLSENQEYQIILHRELIE